MDHNLNPITAKGFFIYYVEIKAGTCSALNHVLTE